MQLLTTTHSTNLKSGFTLVEILMTLGIVSMLLITLTQVFGGIISLRLKSDITTTLAQDSRYLLSILEYDLASATNVTSPAVSTSVSNLTLTSRNNTITYIFDGTTLTRTVSGVSAPIITETLITDFTATRGLDNGGKPIISIIYTLTTPAISDAPAQSRTFTTSYGLRTLWTILF